MIDSEGRLFGRVNLLDLGILLVLAVALVAFGLTRSGKAGIHAKVEGTTMAEIDCFIRGSIGDPAGLMKAGDKTFITLRNVPYSAVEVVKVTSKPKSISVPSADGKSVIALPDPAEPYGADMLVTIREKATVTDDGVVFGDSKVKIGTPIELEGFKYRLRGSIIDVRVPGI